MYHTEKIYFEPGKNPPFPGYEAWLDEVKRAPIWQAKAPRQFVLDGVGKELFPPPPPRSNLEPEFDNRYDRETALAAIQLIWDLRPDLIWELIWWKQYCEDDPDEGERLTKDRKYDDMFRYSIMHEFRKKFTHLNNLDYTNLRIEIQNQIHIFFPFLPISIRSAPWLCEKYKS